MVTNIENLRIINLTVKFKNRLRNEIEENKFHSDDMRECLWKVIIMTEIAHRSFSLGTKIEPFEKQYFDRQAAVGRYFCDWGMDWVAEYYFEISNYVAAFYWPDNDRVGFKNDYVPFRTFNLEE